LNSATPVNRRGKLPRTVVIIGLVSLLNDFASEMVVPLIPLLLATVLAGGPLALGLIDVPMFTGGGASHTWWPVTCCPTWSGR
jgi:hypothetical protein